MASRFSQEMDRTMSEEQFCQVVDAILNGKYSWACLLILRFSGYNPLHYIPYRTYNRLMKENKALEQEKRHQECEKSLVVDNLPHIHMLESRQEQVRGGYRDNKTCFLNRTALSRIVVF
jgi:hypothetical protein